MKQRYMSQLRPDKAKMSMRSDSHATSFTAHMHIDSQEVEDG